MEHHRNYWLKIAQYDLDTADSKLSWEVDESVEAIPYSAEELNNPEPSSFVFEILKTGKTVYERVSN